MSNATPLVAPAGDGSVRRRFRASHGFVTLGVAAALVGILSGILVGSGNADHLVDLLPGRAWLANDERGSLTLVNGATGSAEFEMRFTDAAGSEFEVVQGDEGVFVVNRTTGEITRIDGATQTLGRSIRVDVASEPLFVIGGGRAYLVLRADGTIQEIDPRSADLDAIGEPVQVGAVIGSAVVDDDGVLAAAVLGTGEITFVEGAAIAGRVVVNPPGDPMAVTLVDDRVVAVTQDTGRGEVAVDTVLPDGVERSQPVDVPVVGEVLVAPKMDGGQLWLLHGESATLAGVPLGDGQPRVLSLEFARGDALGAPLPNGSFVYVPNFDQGALLKVDAQTGAFVDIVPVGDDTLEFEAFVENGRVWGNDPVGGSAVVIDRDGNVQRVEKYQPGIPSNDPGASAGSPSEPDQPIVLPEDRRDPDALPGSDPLDPGPGLPTDPGAGGSATPDPGLPSGPGAPVDPGGGVPNDPTPPTVPDAAPPPPPAAGVPGAPGGVSASGADALATVSWLPALDNGSALLRYVVTSSTADTQTVDAATTVATFSGLTNGVPLTFSVRAENAIGAGPAATSNSVTPEPAVPGAPSDVLFQLVNRTPQAAAISIVWDVPAQNPSAVFDSEITCTGSGSIPFTVVVPITSKSHQMDVPDDDDYSCAIRARNLDGVAGPEVAMAPGATLRPFSATARPSLDRFRSVTSPLLDGYRTGADVVAPVDGKAFTGYVFEVYAGAALVDRQTLPASEVAVLSAPLEVGVTYTYNLYTYTTDPISGITVTSTMFAQTFPA